MMMKLNQAIVILLCLLSLIPNKVISQSSSKPQEYLLSEKKWVNSIGLDLLVRRVEIISANDTLSKVAIKFRNKTGYDNGYIDLLIPNELNSFIDDLEFLASKFGTKEFVSKSHIKYRMDINNELNAYYKASLSKRVFFYETIAKGQYTLEKDKILDLIAYLKSLVSIRGSTGRNLANPKLYWQG